MMSPDERGRAQGAVSPTDALYALISGHQRTQMIYVAAKLGIADRLVEGPRRAEELAVATGTHAPSLYRLLRALASLGVFEEVEEGRFGLNPLAELLRSDVPGSLRYSAIRDGEEHYRAWGELLHSVRTGQSAFQHLYGMSFFEYVARHPESANAFNRSMTARISRIHTAIVDAYDFSSIQTLVDVGGGHGGLLAAILQAYPQMQGILFDFDFVVDDAGPVLEAAGVAARCRIEAGDAMISVPAGGDAYMLVAVIHGMDDDRAATVLKNCRAAMPAHGRILVVEQVLPAGTAPSPGKVFDLNMLVMAGGRERSEAEFKRLFELASFELTRVIPTAAGVSIVEGAPEQPRGQE